jgi:hypothetical protein
MKLYLLKLEAISAIFCVSQGQEFVRFGSFRVIRGHRICSDSV